MIKAAFFDLYQTLICYRPPREEVLSKVLKELGIEVTPEALLHPIVIADEFIYQEHARLPIRKRNDDEKNALWGQYQAIVLKEAGIEPNKELIRGVLGRMQQVKFEMALFDDVLPALSQLKNKGLILGLISNVDNDITPVLSRLGLKPLLQVVVTSQDAGCNKPKPEIFREAARRAGIQTQEAIYIGDQYQIDVIGANEAGMQGILIDRGGYFKEAIKEPKIQSLYQLTELLL
jgi:putative hydrolase of the HAD superfamily